jgi:hypothetical protein
MRRLRNRWRLQRLLLLLITKHKENRISNEKQALIPKRNKGLLFI